MRSDFYESIHDNPIIASINDFKQIDDVIKSPSNIAFLLTGDILNIKDAVKKLKDNNKLVFIHVDLIGGFSKDVTALKFINQNIKPDGIITTKSNLIKAGQNFGMLTIQRLFLLDSLSIESGINSIKQFKPDAIEILPGLIPRMIGKISNETRVPVIAGGLIEEKEDVINCLNSGAIGISTSNKRIWYL